jgi:hypothetical protein
VGAVVDAEFLSHAESSVAHKNRSDPPMAVRTNLKFDDLVDFDMIRRL